METCPLCELPGRLERHHPTGRVDGKPIHPDLLFRICGPCNRAQNLLWQMTQLDGGGSHAMLLQRRLGIWLEQWPLPLTPNERKIVNRIERELERLVFNHE